MECGGLGGAVRAEGDSLGGRRVGWLQLPSHAWLPQLCPGRPRGRREDPCCGVVTSGEMLLARRRASARGVADDTDLHKELLVGSRKSPGRRYWLAQHPC